MMRIIEHFFAGLSSWLDEMDDPRNQSYILYTQSDLVWMGLLKNMCAVRTMRSMEDSFNTETCIETLKLLSRDRALKEMIHAGRERWKIENEGFNNQKNRIYGIRHLNSRNRTATKNHYLLTQVADIIMQLYLA